MLTTPLKAKLPINCETQVFERHVWRMPFINYTHFLWDYSGKRTMRRGQRVSGSLLTRSGKWDAPVIVQSCDVVTVRARNPVTNHGRESLRSRWVNPAMNNVPSSYIAPSSCSCWLYCRKGVHQCTTTQNKQC